MSDSTPPPPANEPTNASPTPPPPPPTGGGYQPAPAPAPGVATGGVGQPADLLMRFLARLIDFVLLAVVLAIINAVILAAMFSASATGSGIGLGGSYAFSAVSAVLSSVVYLGYFSLMESRSGQTLGKMLLKLQTQGPAGATPTLEQAVKRNLWTAAGILGVIPFLGLITWPIILIAEIMIAVTINNSPTKQGWHDNFAGGTKVIKIG